MDVLERSVARPLAFFVQNCQKSRCRTRLRARHFETTKESEAHAYAHGFERQHCQHGQLRSCLQMFTVWSMVSKLLAGYCLILPRPKQARPVHGTGFEAFVDTDGHSCLWGGLDAEDVSLVFLLVSGFWKDCCK